MIDISKEVFLLEEDLIERRRELYEQMRFIVNELEKIDQIYGNGKYYINQEEARKIMRLPPNCDFPSKLQRVTFRHRTKDGVLINTSVFERHDIDVFMAERKR